MSIKGAVLYHPLNGTTEQTWEGFSFPALFFGVFWLLMKGLFGHFLVNFLIVAITSGIAAPVVWFAYGLVGNSAHKSSLLKQGYLTEKQWSRRELTQPVEHRIEPSAPQKDVVDRLKGLAELRDSGVITEDEFQQQKSKILSEY